MTPFRIGWIGCGRVVQEGHVPAMLRAPAHLVAHAVADPDPACRKAVADALGVPAARCYAAHRELLALEGMGAVVVATPHAHHAGPVSDALDAGLAVLCEKPLAPTEAQAASLVARGGGPLGVVHNYLHAPLWRRALAIAAEGRLGRPRSMRVEIRAPGPLPGFQASRPDWRLDADLGVRGCVLDQGYHFFYLAPKLFGAMPVLIEADIERRRGRLDDHAVVTMGFPGGERCTMILDWTTEGEALTRYDIGCERGWIRPDEDRSLIEVDAGIGCPDIEGVDGGDAQGFEGALVDWLDRVARNLATPPLDESLAVLGLIDQCYAASSAGAVTLPVRGWNRAE